MSWVAEAKAMASANEPITHTASGWLDTPASPRPSAKRATCPIRIQPRFRPRNGGGKRSIDGDHSSLKDHGAWARVKRPITLMSTPARAIQAGMASHTRPSGRPEEKESRATESSLQLPVDRAQARPEPDAAFRSRLLRHAALPRDGRRE